MGGKDEDHDTARIKKIPRRSEVGMAEVVVPLAVAGKKDNPVGAQLLEGVYDLGMRRLGVQQRRDGSEEAVALRTRRTDSSRELIRLATELGLLLAGWQNIRTWCGNGKERECDVFLVVEREVLF